MSLLPLKHLSDGDKCLNCELNMVYGFIGILRFLDIGKSALRIGLSLRFYKYY